VKMGWIGFMLRRAQNKIGHAGEWRFVYRSLAGRLGCLESHSLIEKSFI